MADQRRIYPITIYIKLGKDKETAFNGRQTAKIYEAFIREQGAAWMGTNVLILGMAEERRIELMSAIRSELTVEIFFAVGMTYDDGYYMISKAQVCDLMINRQPIPVPEEELTPSYWQQAKARTWLKLKDWQKWRDSGLDVCDYQIMSSGQLLSEAVQKSQVHYGYLIRK